MQQLRITLRISEFLLEHTETGTSFQERRETRKGTGTQQ